MNRPGHEVTGRIRLIDALRGLSLAGIVMVHFGEQYLGFMPPPGQPYNVHGTLDGVLEALSWVFIRGKGFGIFSFMFGLSFVLQMQRAERRRPGTDFRPRFAWRLLILFAIGWLHGLAYSGDILTVYAALGIPLILFYRVRDRWLLVLAVLLLVGVPRIAQRVVQGPATPAELQSLQVRMNAQAEEHWRAVAGGDVPAIVRLHATTGFRAKWEFQYGFMGRGYQTFGLFLLGLWAGRRRLFEDVETHRRLFVRLWRWTGALTLLVPLVAGVLFAVGQAAGGGQPQPAGRHVARLLELAGRRRHGLLRRLEQRHDPLLRGVVRPALPASAVAAAPPALRPGRPDGPQRLRGADRDRRARLLRLRPRSSRPLRQQRDPPDGSRPVRGAGLGVLGPGSIASASGRSSGRGDR